MYIVQIRFKSNYVSINSRKNSVKIFLILLVRKYVFYFIEKSRTWNIYVFKQMDSGKRTSFDLAFEQTRSVIILTMLREKPSNLLAICKEAAAEVQVDKPTDAPLRSLSSSSRLRSVAAWVADPSIDCRPLGRSPDAKNYSRHVTYLACIFNYPTYPIT